MADPLIEGIMNPEPKPGLVDKARECFLPESTDTDTDVEEKREALAILVSMGTAKDYIGVQMSLGDVKKLSPKDVCKYYFRYQSVLSKQVTDGMVENGIKFGCKMISRVIPIDDPDSLSSDLEKDEIVKRELVKAAGYLVLKGGRFVALASALFHVVRHVDFSPGEKIVEESEHDAEHIYK